MADKRIMRSASADQCPLCRSAGHGLYAGLEDRFFGAGGTWDVSECRKANCGLLWMNPMPVTDDLGLAYQQYFTHGARTENRLRRLFLGIYRLANTLPEALTGLGRARCQMDQMYLDGRAPGRLLDIGCGDGRFLHSMRPLGWQCEGVEVDPAAVAQARKEYGMIIFQGQLEEARFPADSFAAITLRHLLEHVPHPVDLLKECRRILKPGGRMVVVTPNTASLGHRRFGQHWMGLDQPRHLMLYNPTAISACARQAGWEQFSVETSAANADTFFAVSLSLERRGSHALDTAGCPEIGRALKAVWLQHSEALALRRDRAAGEELVLIATK